MSGTKYPCPHCGKSYGTKHSYLEHLNCHSNLRPHKCKVCGLTFSYRSSLYNHSRVHSMAKPFVCSYCGIGFRWKNSRQIHEKKCRSKPHTAFDKPPPVSSGLTTNGGGGRALQTFGPEIAHVFGVVDDVHKSQEASRTSQVTKGTPSSVPWSPCPFCLNLFQYGASLTRHVETCAQRPPSDASAGASGAKNASATVSFNLGIDPVKNGWLDLDMSNDGEGEEGGPGYAYDEEPADYINADGTKGLEDYQSNPDGTPPLLNGVTTPPPRLLAAVKQESGTGTDSTSGSPGMEEPEYRMTLTVNDDDLHRGGSSSGIGNCNGLRRSDRKRNPKHLSALEKIVANIHQAHSCNGEVMGENQDGNSEMGNVEPMDSVSSTTDESGLLSGPCPGAISLETLARQQAELQRDLASLRRLLAAKLGSIEAAVNQLKTGGDGGGGGATVM